MSTMRAGAMQLAAAVGEDAAARVARAMLLDTWDVVTAVEGVAPILATTNPAADHGLGPVTAWDQGGGDLGARQVRFPKGASEGVLYWPNGSRIWAIPEDVEADAQQLAALARLLEMSPAELGKKLEDEDKTFVWLKRQLDEPVAQQVAAEVAGANAVRLTTNGPYPALLAQLLAQLVTLLGAEFALVADSWCRASLPDGPYFHTVRRCLYWWRSKEHEVGRKLRR